MEIMDCHRNIAAASTELHVRESREDKVETEIGDRTSIQIQSFDLSENFTMKFNLSILNFLSYLFSLFHCVKCRISLNDFTLLDDLVEAQQSALHFWRNLSQIGNVDQHGF